LADAAHQLGGAAGITTFSEPMLRTTAELAELLRVPFHGRETAQCLTDKALQRYRLNAAGVSPVRHALVRHGADFERALDEVGLPVVIKPLVGRASADTFGCETRGEFATLVEALVEITPSGGGWVVEERLATGEHPAGSWLADYCSVESAVSGDRVWHYCVTDKLPLAPPFRETGDSIPTRLPDDLRQAVCAMAEAALRATGITVGLVHTEIKLTPAGPRVIEVNGRLGGDIARLLRRATGFDPVRLALELALGGSFEPYPLRYDRAAFFRSVMPPQRPVTVRELSPPSRFRSVPGVWAVDRPAREGRALDWRRGTGEVVFTVWAETPVADGVPELLRVLDERAADCVRYVD
jgi:biotin carboxylase